MFRPFVINSNICCSYDDIVSYDKLMYSVAGNVGNSYITYALLKELGLRVKDIASHELKNIIWGGGVEDLSEKINQECTHVILVMQDQIRQFDPYYKGKLPYKELTSLLDKINKPLLVAGLGSNAFSEEEKENILNHLAPDLVDFLIFISNKCKSIGVRGKYTKQILEELGIKNVVIIGCPSYYETGFDRYIQKKDKYNKYGCSLLFQHDIMSNSDFVFYQDMNIVEKMCIESMAYGKYRIFLQPYYDIYKSGRVGLFPSIPEWKSKMQEMDFFVSLRVHGAMVAINSGVPAIVLNPDARAREMCEYLNIPYRPDLINCSSMEELYDACNVDRLNTEYNDKLKKYIKFLKENGFSYNPILDDSDMQESLKLTLCTKRVLKYNFINRVAKKLSIVK